MANEIRKTVAVRATAWYETAAARKRVTDRQNVEASVTEVKTESLKIVHRNVEAWVGSSLTAIATETQEKKQNAVVVFLGFHASPTMSLNLNHPGRY